MNSLPLSYGYVTISLPISCFLMIFTSIFKIIKIVINFKDDSYNVKKDNPAAPSEDAGLEPKAEKL